ncbi:hypothetical protein DP107_03005 [Haloglomus irregulare]|uniref:Uncharacterized protein n=1 Tax=Haloglomus irregulare TaxID=2234134 RepID=A0A554NFJ7_9EURY|nr:hypothetical protein [Haloglomus irregulare]TSD16151.1 hypothetical protein DP107_03005 [Haloglomus irregulare]
MPDNQHVDTPEAATTVAEQYLRRERPASALVSVVVVAVFLGTFHATSLLPAIAVGVGLLALVRAPIIRLEGTVQLRTEETVGAVAAAFSGPTPPVLPFQWGIADEVTTDGSTATYQISYLFGMRTVEMTVRTDTTTRDDGVHEVRVAVAANGAPWSTYTVTIDRHDDRTMVEYTYESDRRIGLRRLPQRRIAKRYRDSALRAQGYTVLDRTEEHGIRS